ncbi:hypothetical protein OROGR_019087 [Orobanche gracilis]
MEMCTARGISKPSLNPVEGSRSQTHPISPFHNAVSFHPQACRENDKFLSILVTRAGLRHCRSIYLRSATSGGTSTETTPHEKHESEPDGVTIVKNSRTDYSKQVYNAK